MICNVCGKENSIVDKKCSFCDNDITQEYKFLDYEKEFKEKEINIQFNLRSIVNELDYKRDYENNAIDLVDEKYQYLQSDITKKNKEKIKSIIIFYNDKLSNFIKNERHKLETAGTEDLQEIIMEFNNIVNICNKYKKFINDKKIENELQNTIIKYNKEINYIKKYFVLPLYEADKILAASRLAKNLINIMSICFCYFIVSKIPFMITIYTAIANLFITAGQGVNFNLAMCDIKAFASFFIGLGLTEVLFAYYISFTIKNRNFKVDKHKNFEPIYYFVPVFFVLSLYNPILSYIYNLWFLFYIVKTVVVSLLASRFAPQWLIVKIITIIFALITAVEVMASVFIK